MITPYLMVHDPEIINDVLIKNFSSFPDRGVYSDFVAEPLSNHLFFMENPQRKIIRNKLSPFFTLEKLKMMYDQIKEWSDEWMKTIEIELIKNDNEIEVRDIIGKYSTDVIRTCTFRLKLNSIKDDETLFLKHDKTLFEPSLRTFSKNCIW